MILKFGKDKVFPGARALACIAGLKGSTTSKDDCLAGQYTMALFAPTVSVDTFACGFARYFHKVMEKECCLEKGYRI